MAASRDLAVFYRTLAQFLTAGVIASEALRGCAPCLPEAMAAAAQVARGDSLSVALGRFPRVFPAEHLRLLGIGERSGFLDTVLVELADYAEQAAQARGMVRSGLVLPAVILHIVAFVLPLPALVLGRSLPAYLASAFGFIAVLWLVAAARAAFLHRASNETLDPLFRRVPVLRTAWCELDYWRIASCLRMLARTSVGLPEALRFVAGICRGPARARALRVAADLVEQRGEPASPTLRASGAFPAEMMIFWANGEKSGRLDDAFASLAARYAASFQQRLREVARWLPRIAYLLVCGYLVIQILRAAGSYVSYLNQV